jgi:alpha-beta hydrolase superfamily lysophospholipase
VGPAGSASPWVSDSSFVWRNQIQALVGAGFRVVAPDLRGFGASDKPQDVDAYRITTLVEDVIAILDAVELERAHVTQLATATRTPSLSSTGWSAPARVVAKPRAILSPVASGA